MSDQNNFYTLIFTKSSLYMNEKLESAIAKLVNEAFSEIPNFGTALRYEKDSDVSKELGDDGLIAIAFDPVPGADRDIPIACISAKKYEPPIIEGETVDVSKRVLFPLSCIYACKIKVKRVKDFSHSNIFAKKKAQS